MGYLSLRLTPTGSKFVLDYPNHKVRISIAKRLLDGYFERREKSVTARNKFALALFDRDPASAVSHINSLLAILPYDNRKTQPRDEEFYCKWLYTFFTRPS
jgi:hypothetical protein